MLLQPRYLVGRDLEFDTAVAAFPDQIEGAMKGFGYRALLLASREVVQSQHFFAAVGRGLTDGEHAMRGVRKGEGAERIEGLFIGPDLDQAPVDKEDVMAQVFGVLQLLHESFPFEFFTVDRAIDAAAFHTRVIVARTDQRMHVDTGHARHGQHHGLGHQHARHA